MVHHFPYMESSELYDLMDFNRLWYTWPYVASDPCQGWPTEVFETVIPMLICPSDAEGVRTIVCPVPDCRDLSTSNYLAFFSGQKHGDISAYEDRPFPTPLQPLPNPPLKRLRAVFGANRGAKFGQITDGTSKTMVFGEHLTGYQTRGMFWTCGPGRGILFTQETPNSSAPDILDPDACIAGSNRPELNRPCRRTSDPAWRDSTATARSMHPGGVYVLMADGSTHFVSNDIDLEMWRGMTTMGGEEAKSFLP
jgi:hypothetical protein